MRKKVPQPPNLTFQYTLAIDRADEAVSHLYDPWHPAVLRLISQTISKANELGKEVCVCGEMAGDPALTRLLLGLGSPGRGQPAGYSRRQCFSSIHDTFLNGDRLE